jgi:hypothetical protein
MPQFKTLSANFTVSTMIEHGKLSFFLDGTKLFDSEDEIVRRDMVLSPGEHSYQWQVNGIKGVTRYSIRLLRNGTPIPGTGIGPKVLKNGDTDFNAGTFTI